MDIIRIAGALPADIATLAPFATAEGIGIIDTLIAEWASGENRFTRPGELLSVARLDGRLAGTGGITYDYNFPDALRMRRFYVHPDFRRHGVARALAEHVIAHARTHATWLTCHTGTNSGRRFWERMGFVPVPLETHTHEIAVLVPPAPVPPPFPPTGTLFPQAGEGSFNPPRGPHRAFSRLRGKVAGRPEGGSNKPVPVGRSFRPQPPHTHCHPGEGRGPS